MGRKHQGWVWLAVAAVVGGLATSAQAVFPLEENVAVATFAPISNSSAFVVGTYDIRDPDCNGVLSPTCDQPSQSPPCITNWPAAQYHNEFPGNPTNNPQDVWNEANLGRVFGIALDNAADPSIYVTSSSVFGGVASGRVMKISGTSGAISLFATLPNTGPGLGNIAFDRISTHFYVTNHEDGKIYNLDAAGLPSGLPYDPFAADDASPGFAPLGERLWGIEIKHEADPNDRRLYFGRWTEDQGSVGGLIPNEVWSVGLALNGDIVGPETPEVTLPVIESCTRTQPVADLAFSEQGRMLLGQRTMSGPTFTGAHRSTTFQYELAAGVWVLSFQFEVGLLSGTCGGTAHVNSAGGVDYTDCVEADECNPGDLAVFVADALDLNAPGPNPNNIYGLQLTPAAGGSPLDSYYVDLDNDLATQDKTVLGDVDVVRTCVQPPAGTGACCTVAGVCVNALTQTDCQGGGGRYAGDNTTCATFVFDPPCSSTPPLEPKLDAIEVKLDELKPEVVDIKAEITDLKAESVDIKAEITDLKVESVDIKAEITDLKAESVDIKAEIVDILEKIDLDIDFEFEQALLECGCTPNLYLPEPGGNLERAIALVEAKIQLVEASEDPDVADRIDRARCFADLAASLAAEGRFKRACLALGSAIQLLDGHLDEDDEAAAEGSDDGDGDLCLDGCVGDDEDGDDDDDSNDEDPEADGEGLQTEDANPSGTTSEIHPRPRP